MNTNSGKDIITRLQSNDRTAMQLLFQEYYPFVCNRIYNMIKDRATVEDIAQDVFIKIWEKRQQINIQTSVKAYIQRMAFNETISYLRKHKKHKHDEITPSLSIAVESSEQQLLKNELENHITEAINQLPNRCRLIFQMNRFEELTYREIAEKLEISIKTVENQMGKALKILRQTMKPYINKK